MFRGVAKFGLSCLIVLALALGLYFYRTHHGIEAQLEAAQDRNAELELIVDRLSAERRVADVLVTEQARDASGELRTQLLFVEYDHIGNALPARHFTIDGQVVHIDAQVVKFDGRYVQTNDRLRGRSVALFTRLYGEKTPPAQGQPIDTPGQIPDVYRSSDATVTQFETRLWSDFWRLADDPAYRKEMGVRVAEGEGVWRPFVPGYLYTITLENNGGLNITADKVRGIYEEALHQRAGSL